MESNIEIMPQESSIIDILNSQKFISEYQKINNSICNQNSTINTIVEEINSIEAPAQIEKNLFGGAKPKSIEKSISSVFTVIRPYILSCGKAIRSTNNNLQRTLSLIKLIATAESTIYQQFDEQITNQNELKEIISDWCKQNGIHDEQVNELLESSFQRAYTLRDRINQVKLQVSIANKKISETNQIAKSTETQVNNLDTQIKNIQERIPFFERYISETKEADSNRDKRIENLDHYINGIKEADAKRDEQLENIYRYISETIEADSKRDKRIENLDHYINGIKAADAKRNERLENIDCYISEIKTDYQEMLSSYSKIKRNNIILCFVITGIVSFVLLSLLHILQ